MSSTITKTEVYDFLINNPLSTLATIGEGGVPELAAVYAAVTEDLHVTVVTKVNTRKYQNVLAGSPVSLLVCSEAALISIEISGRATTLTDPAAVVRGIEKFQTIALTRSAQYWIPPIAQVEAGQYVVIEIIPKVVTYRQFSQANETIPPVETKLIF